MAYIYVCSLLYRAKLCALLALAVDFCEYALIAVFLVLTGKLTGCLIWFVTVWSPHWSILRLMVMYCYTCLFLDSKTVGELLKDSALHRSFGCLLFWRFWLAAPHRMNVFNKCTCCAGNWFFNPLPPLKLTISTEVSENGDYFTTVTFHRLEQWTGKVMQPQEMRAFCKATARTV
jgi:hypothetical protein